MDSTGTVESGGYLIPWDKNTGVSEIEACPLAELQSGRRATPRALAAEKAAFEWQIGGRESKITHVGGRTTDHRLGLPPKRG